MPSYTSPDCLPYFDGGDAPCLNTGSVCEPSTVWCDFANAVEVKLDAYDDLVRRTAESVPMAWVETIEAVTFDVANAFLPTFTTVRNDTDDMVDFDVLSSGFQVNTSGLYILWAYMIGSCGAANVGTVKPRFTIAVRPTVGPISFFHAESGALTANLAITIGAQFVTPVTAGQQVILSLLSQGNNGNLITFTKVAMGGIWVGDLP